MEEKEKGMYMVGIRDPEVNIDDLKVGISGIRGVFQVQVNYLTRKLIIGYDGTPQTLGLIKEKLRSETRPSR